MNVLIGEKDLVTALRRASRNTWVFRVLVVASLAVFIVLCLNLRTINARNMTKTMILGMTLLGWACMGWYMGMLLPSRAKAHHLETLTAGEPKTFEGRLYMAGTPEKIPKSVWVQRVMLAGDSNPDTMEEPERKRLNLDVELTGQMPAEGSRIRVKAVHGYITGVEILEPGNDENAVTGRRSRMRLICRRVGYLAPFFILWALLVIVIGGFIFNRLMDARPENKLVVYADCEVRKNAELANRLEKELEDPIRLVQVRSFDYAMFQESGINGADLYIVSGSRADEYREVFAPLPTGLAEDEECLVMDGVPWGIPVRATEYFVYDPAETYYLVFGKNAPHLEGNDGAVDNQAVDAARFLIELK